MTKAEPFPSFYSWLLMPGDNCHPTRTNVLFLSFGAEGGFLNRDGNFIQSAAKNFLVFARQQSYQTINFKISNLLTIIPSKTGIIRYGKYMVNASSCADCHTNQVKEKVAREPFAGGFKFKFPDGSIVHSSNITPDRLTGIGSWAKEEFIASFKMYEDSAHRYISVQPGAFQTPMPWIMYAGMTTEDLSAVFAYIHSLKPVENEIVKFTPSK